MSDSMINKPPHYHAESGVEVISAIECWSPDQGRGFMIGNIIKYVARSGHKEDDLQDLLKAQYYLNRLIQNTQAQKDKAVD